MPLYIKIALRYLLGKKSTNAINLITGISIVGIAIGTAALILILSVFNGFEVLMKKYLDAFNPEIKIEASEGKFFEVNDSLIYNITELDNVQLISQTVEEVAIFDYNENQQVGVIKGVDLRFEEVSGLGDAMFRGELVFEEDDIKYCSVGAGLAAKLNINIRDPITPLKVYMLKRNRRGALDSEFKSRTISPSSIFSLRNQKDQEYVIADLAFVQELLELRNKVSYLEIKLNNISDEKKTQKELIKLLGPDYHVMNRYEQDASFLKVMNIEKWSAFLILGFTLMLIIFNVIGSLWMIVLEKKRDISVLQALGYQKHFIKRIFYTEGFLISFIGFILGLSIAIALYIIQLKYGIIGVSNAFSSTAYPILMSTMDVLAVFVLVLALGLLASVPASRRASEISAFIRSE